MNRIVITGATSFIGIHLIKELLNNECEIYAVIRSNSTKKELLPNTEQLHIIELDMADYDVLPELISCADQFWHFAWEGTRGKYRSDAKMQEQNYLCSLKAFHAAKKMNCKFFLGSGSQAEYGSRDVALSEQTVCNPDTEYGKWKQRTCSELLSLASDTDMRFVWTRIFSLYGEDDAPGTLVSMCIDKMLKNEPIELTECRQMWDFLYVNDAINAMLHIAEQENENGIFNLASGDIRPLKEYVIELKEILNSESILNFGAVPYSGKITNLIPNINKLCSTGWQPQTEFRNGILKIMKERNTIS